MGKKARALVKRQAAEGKRYIVGPVSGAVVFALVEALAWSGLEALGVPPLSELHGSVVAGLIVIVAAVGGLVGWAFEYGIRRFFIAPGEVIEGLSDKLALYEEGPKFVLYPVGSVTVVDFLDKPNGQPTGLMFIVEMRVTNEGAIPGAALDWIAWLRFKDGTDHNLKRIASDNHRVGGTGKGSIPRGHLLWERTAKALTRGETKFGYYLGVAPFSMKEKLEATEWEFNIACRDYRQRPYGVTVSVERDTDTHETFRLAEPTLSPIEFEKRRRADDDEATP